jgi:hypothetical protein
VHGSGYERIASPGCSDRTIRRRLTEWAEHGRQLLRLALAAFDQMVGLQLDDLAVDGCITKAPCGGEVAGRSPVDRGKQGMKRSATRCSDGAGLPLHLVAARANDHDSPLLEPTLAGVVDMIGSLPQYRDLHGRDEFPNVHLDRGYDSGKTRDLLEVLGFTPHIALKGQPAPIQAGYRWPVERLHAWMNGYGKLRRCTDKRKVIVEFYLYLAAALTVIRRLINRAGRPAPRPVDSADPQLPVALSSRQ